MKYVDVIAVDQITRERLLAQSRAQFSELYRKWMPLPKYPASTAAKPGSDPALYHYIKRMCDDLANPVGQADVPGQVFDLPDAKPEADRIWDLVVLAARASRYE